VRTGLGRSLGMTAADSVPVVVGHARTGIRALTVRGRTFVPARGVFERLGARVSYTPPRLFVRRGDDAVAILHLDTPLAIVHGEPRVLDAPPFVRDRRVFVPLRLVSEILGAQVSYAGRPREVRITPAAAPHRPRVRPVPAAAPAPLPAPVRRAVPWWTFVPLAVVLALAGALAAALRRRTSCPPAVRVRVRAEPVREELVVEYASSVVRIPLRDGDQRNAR
jgi:hypothetical protein